MNGASALLAVAALSLVGCDKPPETTVLSEVVESTPAGGMDDVKAADPTTHRSPIELDESWVNRVGEAAERGDANAQYSLAIYYRYTHDQGSAFSNAEALKWFTRAADAARIDAMTELGKMYMEGIGVPLDYKNGANWYIKAAEFGDTEAQFALAEAYVDGLGVPVSLVHAYKWFNISSSYSGSEPIAKLRRDMLESRMTREQIAEAQKLSSEWKPQK